MSVRDRSVAAGAAGLAALLGLLGPAVASEEPTKPDPDSPGVVARGKVIYDQYCASCHGANLEGQPNWRHRLPTGALPAPPHDVTGHTWHHADQDLFEMVKNGVPSILPNYKTDMPTFKGLLSDADIWAVLSFIESTWPADIRARQQQIRPFKR